FLRPTASCIITCLAQEKGEAIVSAAAVPVSQRLANVPVSYVRYLWKMIYPDNLAVFYPYVRAQPAWQVAGAILMLAAITLAVLWGRRNHPYLIVGWFWYLGTLVPVIGLIQVGGQSMADRYTYIP